jgi:hypothetical protein
LAFNKFAGLNLSLGRHANRPVRGWIHRLHRRARDIGGT